MAATCGHHDEMVKADGKNLKRAEFWTIIVPLVLLILSLTGAVWAASASKEKVDSLNEKVELLDSANDDRAERMEALFKSELKRIDDAQKTRFDKIERYLRDSSASSTGGARGELYR